jgi:hypothetical protein
MSVNVCDVSSEYAHSVNELRNYKKRVSSRNSTGVFRACYHRRAQNQGKNNVDYQLFGLEDVVMMNDFINYLIPEDDGQVASGSVSLPDPVVFETVEQTLEKE